MLLTNISLALVWMALTGRFSAVNFLAGFAVSYFLMWMVKGVHQPSSYFQKVPRFILFVIFVSKELIKANIRVAYEIVTPRNYMKPGVIAVPLEVRTDEEITLLANLITLTPGTLSLDISKDRKALFVHAMYVESTEKFIAQIKGTYERRIKELLR